MTLLRVDNLSVRFGTKTVVDRVSFELNAGERLALVGESGSGKTLTALSLLGLVQNAHTTGSAHFNGSGNTLDLVAATEHQLRGVRGADIAMIFQEPMTALNPLFTIGSQIAEVIQLKQALSARQSSKLAIELLAKTGIPEPARRAQSYPHQLSGGQRQRAMIAMALACAPKLLLADEPTTALDVSLRQGILTLLADLQRESNMAVVLITHDLNLVRDFAHRVAVMEQGKIVEQGPVAEVFGHPKEAYTLKLLNSRPTRHVVELDSATGGKELAQAPPVIGAQNLRVSYAVPLPGVKGWFKKDEFIAVKGVNFTLQKGQTLGIIGESGSGKSTLALAALGLLPFAGDLTITGQSWGQGALADKALRRRVQVVFQDPFSSLSPRMTVEEIVGEGLKVHEPALAADERQRRVTQALHDVGLDEAQYPGLLQRYPHEFSGGQRQRLAIARALIIQPDVLVLDEPTSALDVTIQAQVLQLLQSLQRDRDLAYLLITHDMEVVNAMAHHVLVMKAGEVIRSGSPAQVLGDATV